MELFSWREFLLMLILVLNAIPISKILGRVGLNKWWTIAFLVPFLNIVALWIFAYAHWPTLDRIHSSGHRRDISPRSN
jgi:hypothetical protein